METVNATSNIRLTGPEILVGKKIHCRTQKSPHATGKVVEQKARNKSPLCINGHLILLAPLLMLIQLKRKLNKFTSQIKYTHDRMGNISDDREP